MSALVMDEPGNTDQCGASTPICVEKDEDHVDLVLDPKSRRRYRRNMTKKPTHGLRGIKPEYLSDAFDLARRTRGTSQGDIARKIGCDQQTVSRILRGETREGGWKWPIIQYLESELWHVAADKHLQNLTKDLLSLGLQPKGDTDMTIAGAEQVDTQSEYTFDLFEPWIGRGDAMMTFPARPTAKIRQPNFPHSAKAYAFRMIGDMMRPRYKSGEILDVDPAQEPQIGEDCVFYNAERTRARVGELVGVSPTAWRIVTRPETRQEEGHDLAISEWPICEVIMGSRRK